MLPATSDNTMAIINAVDDMAAAHLMPDVPISRGEGSEDFGMSPSGSSQAINAGMGGIQSTRAAAILEDL